MAWLVSGELLVHNAELETQSEVTELTEKIGQISLANGERWGRQYSHCRREDGLPNSLLLTGSNWQMIDPNQPNKIACGFLAIRARC